MAHNHSSAKLCAQLETASLTDADAAIAWNDRLVLGVRRGFELILGRMAAAGALAKGLDPARLADLCLALVQALLAAPAKK